MLFFEIWNFKAWNISLIRRLANENCEVNVNEGSQTRRNFHTHRSKKLKKKFLQFFLITIKKSPLCNHPVLILYHFD